MTLAEQAEREKKEEARIRKARERNAHLMGEGRTQTSALVGIHVAALSSPVGRSGLSFRKAPKFTLSSKYQDSSPPNFPRAWCSACMLNHFIRVWLCNSVECSLSSSSVHWILQARILEWAAMPFSRGSSWPSDWTQPLMSPALAGGFFTTSATGKPRAWYRQEQKPLQEGTDQRRHPFLAGSASWPRASPPLWPDPESPGRKLREAWLTRCSAARITGGQRRAWWLTESLTAILSASKDTKALVLSFPVWLPGDERFRNWVSSFFF